MFCNNCGAQVDDNATACPYCGAEMKTPETNVPAQPQAQNGTFNVLALLGLIFAFVFPIAGIVLSVLGKKKAVELGGSGAGMAKAGLILSIVFIALYVLYIFLMVIIGVASGLAAAGM